MSADKKDDKQKLESDSNEPQKPKFEKPIIKIKTIEVNEEIYARDST